MMWKGYNVFIINNIRIVYRNIVRKIIFSLVHKKNKFNLKTN